MGILLKKGHRVFAALYDPLMSPQFNTYPPFVGTFSSYVYLGFIPKGPAFTLEEILRQKQIKKIAAQQ